MASLYWRTVVAFFAFFFSNDDSRLIWSVTEGTRGGFYTFGSFGLFLSGGKCLRESFLREVASSRKSHMQMLSLAILIFGEENLLGCRDFSSCPYNSAVEPALADIAGLLLDWSKALASSCSLSLYCSTLSISSCLFNLSMAFFSGAVTILKNNGSFGTSSSRSVLFYSFNFSGLSSNFCSSWLK